MMCALHRTTTAGGAALLLIVAASGTANADVALSGTFTATQECPAFQSMRKSTNPGNVKIEPNVSYELISKNKPDATHFRIVVPNAEPEERWVSISCGHLDGAGQPANATPAAPAAPPSNGSPPLPAPTTTAPAPTATGQRATHVLAMSWEPAFCEQHRDKTECQEMTPTSFDATHLSLHGLWPQPRGTQYCNVPANISDLDENHDWNGLPEPDMKPDTLKRLGAVMPGVGSKLQRHEWIVHGTCFGTDANTYFNRAAGLAESVNASKVSELFAANAGKTVSADAIRTAFDQAFGAGAGQRVTISCHGRGDNRKITELVVSLAGDVKGSAQLGDLILAAQPVPSSCPGGLLSQR